MSSLGDFLQTRFAQHALSPFLWMNTARRLIESAEHLTPAIGRFWESLESENHSDVSVMVGAEYQPIFMMLYGFAIENLCKAYIVTQLNDVDRKVLCTGRLPQRLKSHNLRHLTESEVQLVLDAGEQELLMTLETAVVWAGRYPVSTGPGVVSEQNIRERYRTMPQGMAGDDVPRIRELVDRISTHVDNLIRPPSVGSMAAPTRN